MNDHYMKKLLSITCTLLIVISALTGCGGASSEESEAVEQTSLNAATVVEAQTEAGREKLLYDSSAFMANVPEWEGFAFVYMNDNKPSFREDEIWRATQESLDPLDDLGRCGSARSCIGVDGMPTEPRGDISEVEPSGWHTERYDFVEGEALFNRCHLIGHQLSGDDAIPRNLITGTSYMNRDGMLQFENAIASYVKETENHVMYQVTPIFAGEELIARGVHMQAVSVEDNGEGLAFNVFCYNVQPGIDIDYKTGDNRLSDDTSMLEDYQSGKFLMIANTAGIVPSAENVTAESDAAVTEAGTGNDNGIQSTTGSNVRTYVLNTNTHKFHYPDCKSVDDMKEKNKLIEEAAREDIIARGFEPCGNCHP